MGIFNNDEEHCLRRPYVIKNSLGLETKIYRYL